MPLSFVSSGQIIHAYEQYGQHEPSYPDIEPLTAYALVLANESDAHSKLVAAGIHTELAWATAEPELRRAHPDLPFRHLEAADDLLGSIVDHPPRNDLTVLAGARRRQSFISLQDAALAKGIDSAARDDARKSLSVAAIWGLDRELNDPDPRKKEVARAFVSEACFGLLFLDGPLVPWPAHIRQDISYRSVGEKISKSWDITLAGYDENGVSHSFDKLQVKSKPQPNKTYADDIAVVNRSRHLMEPRDISFTLTDLVEALSLPPAKRNGRQVTHVAVAGKKVWQVINNTRLVHVNKVAAISGAPL